MSGKSPLWLFGALLLISQPAHAWKGDTFQPFVSYGDNYDNNVFYLPKHGSMVLIQNGVPEFIVGPVSDSSRELQFGANVDWRPGRQQILLQASEDLVRYSRYKTLDYNGSKLSADWDWHAGSRWDGSIGASRHTSQINFSNLQVFTLVSDTFTERRAHVDGGFWIDPRWKIGIDSATSTLRNSSSSQSYLNFNQNSLGPFIEYRTRMGSTLTTQLLAVDSRYPNQQFVSGSLVDNSYRENELNITGVWPVTGKTQLQAQLGFIDRRNKNLPQRNFSGFTTGLTAGYSPTGSTSLSLNLYRRSAGADVGYASFVLDTGESVNAKWDMTGTLTLEGGIGHDRFDYEGDPGLAFGFPKRIDNVQNVSLALKYKPRETVTLTLGGALGYRNSSYSLYDYHFDMVFANLKFSP